MKKILVIKGFSAYNVLRCAADEIARGFAHYGYQVEMLDMQEPDISVKLVDCLDRRDEYAFYFSMQAIGWEQECTALPQLQEMRRVGWLVDDPFFHEGRLVSSAGTGAYVLTVQDTFTRRIRENYPKFTQIQTLYHGGFYSGEVPAWEEREIDVFFPGSYTTAQAAQQKLESLDGVFEFIGQKVKDRLVLNGQTNTWDEELRSYLKEIYFEISEEELQTLLRELYPLDEFQRACIREKMLEVLLEAGIRVSVVGKGWDAYAGRGREHLDVLSAEGVDIKEVVRLMQRSKIVLHNINFTSGMHERIFTAMLAGAICVSGEYDLLKRFFANGIEMVMYPQSEPQCLPAIVKGLLSNPEHARKIADAGREKALQKHTWQRRGEQIAKWMEDGQNIMY